MRLLLSAFLCCLLCLVGCRKDVEILTVTVDPGRPLITFVGEAVSIRGRVTDEEGAPIAGAVLTAGDQTTFSDLTGDYAFSEVPLSDEEGIRITARRGGHFLQQRWFLAEPTAFHQLSIVLPRITRAERMTINARAGGVFVTADGVIIDVPPGAATVDEQPYEGAVTVSIHYTDPSSPRALRQSPLNVPARTDNGLSVLTTYGMADLSLTTEDGRPVTFTGDRPVRISVPPPTETSAQPVSEASFWTLTEDSWTDAGAVNLRDGLLQASVERSGTYNYGAPHPAATICGQLLDDEGAPLPDHPFAVASAAGTYLYAFRSDSRGRFCATVARDQVLELGVQEPCAPDNDLLRGTVGPFAAGKTEVAPADVPYRLPAKFLAVSFCAEAAFDVPPGLEIWVNGQATTALPSPGGDVRLPRVSCGGDAPDYEVQAVAADLRRTSDLVRVAGTDLEALDLSVCGIREAGEYFDVEINGENVEMSELSYLSAFTPGLGRAHRLWGAKILENGSDTLEFFVYLPQLQTGLPFTVQGFLRTANGVDRFELDPNPAGGEVATSELTASAPELDVVVGSFFLPARLISGRNGQVVGEPRIIFGTFRINR